jgi:hypothetical protein
MQESAEREEGRRLIRAAFEQARRKGKPDWNAMTIAVLKNRLITEAGGSFDERKFGAKSMADFVGRFPDVVRVDFDRTYPVVTLLETKEGPDNSIAQKGTGRLRPDLWRAVFDYSSGRPYVWDRGTGRAVMAADKSDGPALPTITDGELDQWRSLFAESARVDLSVHEKQQLDRWRDQRLPTALLPPSLRPQWNKRLTTNAIQRLERWFLEHELAAPPDFVAYEFLPTAESPEAIALRRFAQSAIAKMTLAELRLLQLPMTASARVAPVGDPKPR